MHHRSRIWVMYRKRQVKCRLQVNMTMAEAATAHPAHRPAAPYGESAECLTVNPYSSIRTLLRFTFPPLRSTCVQLSAARAWHWSSSLAFKEKCVCVWGGLYLIITLKCHPEAPWRCRLHHLPVLKLGEKKIEKWVEMVSFALRVHKIEASVVFGCTLRLKTIL